MQPEWTLTCLMPPFAWAVDWDIIYCHDASWKDDAEWTLTHLSAVVASIVFADVYCHYGRPIVCGSLRWRCHPAHQWLPLGKCLLKSRVLIRRISDAVFPAAFLQGCRHRATRRCHQPGWVDLLGVRQSQIQVHASPLAEAVQNQHAHATCR